MGFETPKTLATLNGQEVFLYPLLQALEEPETCGVCITTEPGKFRDHLNALERFCFDKGIRLEVQESTQGSWRALFEKGSRRIPVLLQFGGRRRQDSVREGIGALRRAFSPVMLESGSVFIHDTARPFLCPTVVKRLLEQCESGIGVIPALPVADTIKLLSGATGEVQQTLRRELLVRVQTPQVFMFTDIERVHLDQRWEKEDVTDDAQMAESCGLRVRVVEGSERLRKLTTKDDWQWALLMTADHSGAWDKATMSIH